MNLKSVSVYNVAVGDSDGRVNFRTLDTPRRVDLGGSRIVRDSLPDKSGCMQVPMRTLDSVWEENGRPEWRLLKLDVEGNELEVLKGSGDLFASQPPIACIVEFNVPSLSQTSGNLDKLWNFFIQRNYQACNLDGQPREKPSKGISDVLFLLS